MNGKAKTSRPRPLEKKAAFADWFYVPSWKRSVDPASLPASGTTRGPWLVLCDEKGLGERVSRLSRDGQDYVPVKAGRGFARTGDGGYTLDPGNRGELIALFRALKNERRVPPLGAAPVERQGFERAG